MLKFQPGAREYLSKIQALSVNKDGQDVFVGMTLEESVWYQHYAEASFNGTVSRVDGSQEKYLALQDKHEAARLRTIEEDRLTTVE